MSATPTNEVGAGVVKNNFWTSATGHAIVGALATCAGSIALALAQSPYVLNLLGGGLAAVAVKYIVDLLRADMPNL